MFFAGAWEASIFNEKQAPPAPAGWSNRGAGGASLLHSGGEAGPVVLRAFTGNRSLAAGESLEFRFDLCITPAKLPDWRDHFKNRCERIGQERCDWSPV